MSFSAGSPVAVVSLRKHGRVLEVLPGGRYRVVVGGMTMVCQEAQLETVSRSKKEQRRERQAPKPVPEAVVPPPAAAARDPGRFRSIDLHGMTVPEALTALPVFLDRAIREGLMQVESSTASVAGVSAWPFATISPRHQPSRWPCGTRRTRA